MKKIVINAIFISLMFTGISVMSCKGDNQNNGEVDSMEATRPDNRETDITAEPDSGIEMDTMSRTGSDTTQ